MTVLIRKNVLFNRPEFIFQGKKTFKVQFKSKSWQSGKFFFENSQR
jgi:hypothetical protein